LYWIAHPLVASPTHYAVNFSVLAIACWQAVEARNIESEFSEAKFIGLAVFSMSQAFLTGIPIVAVVRDIPEAFYLVLTFLIIVLCMVTLLLIFLPKVFMQRAYAGASAADQRRMMAESVRKSGIQQSSSFRGLQDISGLQEGSSNAFRVPDESPGAVAQPLGRVEEEMGLKPASATDEPTESRVSELERKTPSAQEKE
jgi:hypothetical protein